MRHHHDECPEDERDDGHDVGRCRHGVAGGVERDGEGVERAGADVAEHHAERGQCQEADATRMQRLRCRVRQRPWRGADAFVDCPVLLAVGGPMAWDTRIVQARTGPAV